MTENDYQLAWIIYAASAVGCLLVCFYFTGWMWRYVREPLRVLAAVLLFTPTVVDPARDFYAPAIAMTAMDLLFDVSNDAWRSMADLLIYAAMVFAVYAVFIMLRLLLTKKKRHAAKDAQGQGRAHTLAQQEPELESELTLQQMLDEERDQQQAGLVARR
ncbi:MAG: MFS transporter [Pseudomonas sp.]|jgi:signal transduction histidine kinase|nr:MFS transporter [Pseudomonas sp.]MDY0413369.1 MFS transporter [Pseudomonas sp.]NLO54664.1 MFS transporter [Gammaproteobacteria bacterium]